jgi:hypothetical protein
MAEVLFQPYVHIDSDTGVASVDWSDTLQGEVLDNGNDPDTPTAEATAKRLDAALKLGDDGPDVVGQFLTERLARAEALPPALTTMLDGTMEEEHQAWIEMCKRISATAVKVATEDGSADINDPLWNSAIDQIKYWGETLHRLRLANPEHDAKAYAEAKTRAKDGR